LEVSGQLHAPANFSQGKSPNYALYRRIGGWMHTCDGGGGVVSQYFKVSIIMLDEREK